MTIQLAKVSLDDKYALDSGQVYLSGTQALVRLPIIQRQRDIASGLNTAGFISGYRGSPLGTYDSALWKAQKYLSEYHIKFQPGLNEDLAATSIWGTQQVHLFEGANVDGVFGIWYGKGPGVDRSLDALKHGNSAGTSRHGGVLALAGDDHGSQSSTLAHQSEQVFAAAMMPVLNPATVQEYIDFGLIGFAMSRFTGCWVGFKAISETVESSASVNVDASRVKIMAPDDFEMPPGGLNIRWPDPALEAERRLHGPKMQAIAAFARANPLDRIVLDSKGARLGIMTTGKAHLDLRQALSDLGITEAIAQDLGLRIYKVGLTWPLERKGALRFANGLQQIIVIEEKRSFIEDQLVKILYDHDVLKRPLVVGKKDETGAALLPSEGELSSTIVARALISRLKHLGVTTQSFDQRLSRLETYDSMAFATPPKTQRTPFFCSGCPHNTSTRLPEGSRGLAGIGCHVMVQRMPARNTVTTTHMGGEGANWIGQAPFTKTRHVFQNLGDGTYTHSGLLAMRAAAASGVNITYKILYNDAVAMTGGQPAESGFTVDQIAAQVVAEGAKRVVVVSDEPTKYPIGFFPAGITIHDRDELDRVQRNLREVEGMTVLIYDQTCAAEKRRRRKRGLYPDPPRRIFINDLVCEGCGDCSEKSNCVSVKPLETEFGRKRQIDQSNCNKDFSCANGFCPSFVTVENGSLRKLKKEALQLVKDPFANLPMPQPKELDDPYSILITGIGGTGVITIGALLGMAAHLEGKGCTVLDFTGLSQKNGAVMSHVRLAARPDDLAAVRIGPAGADLLLGCDMVVSASPMALSRIEQGATRVVINEDLPPTAGFVGNTDIDFEGAVMKRSLRQAAGQESIHFVDATETATALMGDSIATNSFMLGYAFQKGYVPLSLEAIERAIELNGAGVEMNKRALAWGRLCAYDPSEVAKAVAPMVRAVKLESTPRESLEQRVDFLIAYQNAAYAQRYRDAVERISAAEAARVPGCTGLKEAVIANLFKLMAYKDEYEVARLYTDPGFKEKLERQFERGYSLRVHLAPPLLTRVDPNTGLPRKREYGAWIFKAFAVLSRLRGLRGTPLDVFGYSQERKTERRLVEEYVALLDEIARSLTRENYKLAVQLARIPEQIRGFGHVKDKNIKRAKGTEAQLLSAFRSPPRFASAAE